MFEFRLNLYRRPDGSLMLRFSWAQRIIFAVIFGLLMGAMIAGDDFSVMGGILSLAAALGALFEDSWTWSAPERTLTHRLGLLGLNQKKSWPAADITGIELREFNRGPRQAAPAGGANPPAAPGKSRFNRPMIGLAFDSASRGMVTIETHHRRKADDLETAAKALAEFIGVPLRRLEP